MQAMALQLWTAKELPCISPAASRLIKRMASAKFSNPLWAVPPGALPKRFRSTLMITTAVSPAFHLMAPCFSFLPTCRAVRAVMIFICANGMQELMHGVRQQIWAPALILQAMKCFRILEIMVNFIFLQTVCPEWEVWIFSRLPMTEVLGEMQPT